MQHASFETINPATGEKIARYELLSTDEAISIAKKTHEAYRSKWCKLSIAERSGFLIQLARALRQKKSENAKLMTTEMGKPITQSEAEVEKCAWTAEVYAENAGNWLANDPGNTDADSSYVAFQPLGLILAIMPWNFPFWQALRCAIPALVAGNAVVLRHSNACPGSALAIEESFKDAGFPEDLFRTIITDHDTASRLIESDYVQGVSLTGSVEAGKSVGGIAGRNLKKLVLELGGSDPFIVLDDANVKEAAEVGANARLINSGQSCIAAKRFIVVKAVAKEFTERFVKEIEKKKTGDPMDPRTDVGPLVNTDAVKKIDSQVKDAVLKGAKVSTGGSPRIGAGAFYEPTVLERVTLEMKVMHEEVFGPAAPVYIVPNEEEAIRVTNDSLFGLGASVWTSNKARGKAVALAIESGAVFVNALVKSDPRMPFGGIKDSGIGRELSKYGLKEFVNVKSINEYFLIREAKQPVVQAVVE